MAAPLISEAPLRERPIPEPANTTPPESAPRPRPGTKGKLRNVVVFKDTLLENHRVKGTSKPLGLLIALLIHAVVIAVPILAGLYYTDTPNLKAFAATLLVAPPPPPPPPPAAPAAVIKTHQPKRVFSSGGKLVGPTYIPRQVAQIKEAPIEPEVLDGIPGGVPGGVPGSQLGGVIGGVISSASRTNAPVPSTAPLPPRAPIRVGGRVKSPRALSHPAPVYPALARQGRVQGIVSIDAVIDNEGNVVEMRVVSGHPLLISAALEAVRKWKYEPTYLNDQPVAVQLIVTVAFTLN